MPEVSPASSQQPSSSSSLSSSSSSIALERHFKLDEIATRWNLSVDVVRRTFTDEPGVLRFGGESRLAGRRYKRRYAYLRVPESVLRRVEERLMQKGRPSGNGGVTSVSRTSRGRRQAS